MEKRIPVAVIGTGWWATAYHLPALVATAGVHVLVEKPVATSAADAYELVRLADDRGMQLIVGYTSQFGAAALGVRQWLRDDMGELVTVSVEFTSRMVPLFEGRDDPADPGRPHPSSYRQGAGGGQALTQLTHAAGMVVWATGSRFEQVAARVDARGLEVDLVDSVAFQLEGDALGVALSSGALSDGVPTRQRIRYTGTGGTIEQDLKAGTARLFLTDGTERAVAPENDEPGYPARRPAEYLIDVVGGEPNVCGDPLPAAHTAAFTEALYRAAETGRWEAVPRPG